MDNDIKTVCTKCGGLLIPDQEKTIYRCTYCGVAFGSSILFDKDAPQKAKESLSIGEFNEADIWYNCVLMREPDNFEAHLGRIYCAGKWKSMYSFDHHTILNSVRSERVLERIEDAIKHTEGQSNEFFTQFKTVIGDLERLNAIDIKIRPFKDKKKDLIGKKNELPYQTEEDIAADAVSSSIASVERDMEPLKQRRTVLFNKFRDSYSALLRMYRAICPSED